MPVAKKARKPTGKLQERAQLTKQECKQANCNNECN